MSRRRPLARANLERARMTRHEWWDRAEDHGGRFVSYQADRELTAAEVMQRAEGAVGATVVLVFEKPDPST
jgi:hypothetical protein